MPRQKDSPCAGGCGHMFWGACNLARPKDGSDYTGPVTLWALAEVA